jgi:hypothetical protein
LRSLTLLVLAVSIYAAEKPSPFTARASEPAVPAAAPVSPVAPVSILRMSRPRPVFATPPPVSSYSVSPVNKSVAWKGEAPTRVPEVPQLKTVPLVVPELVVAQIRPPQVGDIVRGAVKDDVLSKMGPPSTVISMQEDNRFVESLRYDWKGKWIGTVRLVNGRVDTIQQP